MRHIIIGTAGHIDHGKTALVKALTGVDTDTLEEEKRRGITINNGYTYLDIDSENKMAIIDVPGHEKFIKNMVAGVSSIDMVMLIIAADEGIMPQTREHFEVLKMLGLKKGIVVLTKSDLVDKEWLEFMKDEVREFLKESFMKDSKIISVSSKTLDGIDNLKDLIKEESQSVTEKNKIEFFRMPIDRVFDVKGFGTVVTGSIISGSVKLSDEIFISELEESIRVRGIQVHGEDKDFAVAGERCAINITSTSKEKILKGMILSNEKIESSYIVDTRLSTIDFENLELINRQRVRVHHYAKEVMGRIIILDKESIKSNDTALVQLRLEDTIDARIDDNLIIRTYSPMKTIAGARVLDGNAKKAKRFKDDYIDALKLKEDGSIDKKIELLIKERSKEFFDINEIASTLNISNVELIKGIETLESKNKIFNVAENIYIHNTFLLELEKVINSEFNKFYNLNPLKLGMVKETLKSKLVDKKTKNNIFEGLLVLFKQNNILDNRDSICILYNHVVKLSEEQKIVKIELLEYYKVCKFEPMRFDDFIKVKKNKKLYKDVLGLLIDEQSVVYLEDGMYLSKESYIEVQKLIEVFLDTNDILLLKDLKDMIGVSRKYLVAILEKLDREKFTQRQGEGRILNANI